MQHKSVNARTVNNNRRFVAEHNGWGILQNQDINPYATTRNNAKYTHGISKPFILWCLYNVVNYT